MIIAFLLLFILLLMWFIEGYFHKKNLNDIPIRILINGTRGKTSLTRLLTTALNEAGIRTYGKSTGSSAEIIRPDGSVEKIRRKEFGDRFRETILFIRYARKAGAQAVCVECNALSIENQKLFSRFLLVPTIAVITNTYTDHIDIMGWTKEEISSVLLASVPRNAKLFVTEELYKEKRGNVVVAGHNDFKFSPGLSIHPSTIDLAAEVLSYLGIKMDVLENSLDKIPQEIGLIDRIEGERFMFVPSFSINDLECMRFAITRELECDKERELKIVFNSREDREFRVLLFEEAMKDLDNEVLVIGDYPEKCARHMRRRNIRARAINLDALEEQIINDGNSKYLALGNIYSEGEELINRLREVGRNVI